MNIFALDLDCETAARWHTDGHVRKMILETAQMLCTAHHRHPGLPELPSQLYKATHAHHPCSLWARASTGNYRWLASLGLRLTEEFTHRWGKEHATAKVLQWCSANMPAIPEGPLQPFAQCMPMEFQQADSVLAYRAFYTVGKAHLHKWTNRPQPPWINCSTTWSIIGGGLRVGVHNDRSGS